MRSRLPRIARHYQSLQGMFGPPPGLRPPRVIPCWIHVDLRGIGPRSPRAVIEPTPEGSATSVGFGVV